MLIPRRFLLLLAVGVALGTVPESVGQRDPGISTQLSKLTPALKSEGGRPKGD